VGLKIAHKEGIPYNRGLSLIGGEKRKRRKEEGRVGEKLVKRWGKKGVLLPRKVSKKEKEGGEKKRGVKGAGRRKSKRRSVWKKKKSLGRGRGRQSSP